MQQKLPALYQLYKALVYVTSDDFKQCAAENRVHELTSHSFLQLSRTRLYNIHGSLMAKMLGEQPWAN